jgi:hypothetical protein
VETMGNRNQDRPRTRHRLRLVTASLLAVALLGLLGASAAVAASGTSASDQYHHAKAVKPAVVKSAVTSVQSTAATPAKGDLPFTGMSLLSAVVVGGALVGLGVALRRRNGRDAS